MKRQRFIQLLFFTLGMAALLFIIVFYCTKYTTTKMTEFSFQRLNEMTEDVAREYRETIERDFAIMDSMAAVIAMSDSLEEQAVLDVMNTFDYKEPYLCFQLLTKEGKLLNHDGQWNDVSASVDFAKEAQAAPTLTGRCTDFLNPEMLVVRLTAPVIREGETIAVLYGILSLQEASYKYKVNDFKGNAFVMLMDGNTGDILLDTWHNKLGNLRDYAERDFRMGDTVTEAIEDMSHDRSGNMAFISETRGKMIYVHYEPVGYQHLSASIGVLEDVALEGTQTITYSLYTMSIIIFAVLAFYTLTVVIFLLRTNNKIYRMSITDQNTGALNRSAYEAFLQKSKEKVFPLVACVYLDVNGLHELNNSRGHAAGDIMLQTVVEAMRKQWSHSDIYRIGGDEFVVFLENVGGEECRDGIRQLAEALMKQGYSISAGISVRQNEKGLNQVVRDADEDMLKNKASYYAEKNERRQR